MSGGLVGVPCRRCVAQAHLCLWTVTRAPRSATPRVTQHNSGLLLGALIRLGAKDGTWNWYLVLPCSKQCWHAD